MSNRNKLISLAPRKPKTAPEPVAKPAPMPSLKEFWEELQRAKHGHETPTSARGGSGYASSSGRLHGSGSGLRFGSAHGSGSGVGSGGDSGCACYGVDLVAPADHFSRERILTIMRDICEKESKLNK